MPLYNFMEQFATDVESGKKRQTIRKKRKRPTVVGDTLYLYTGLRTKAARKLLETKCVDIRPVTIYPQGVIKGILVGYDWLQGARLERFAKADGFETVDEFCQFFLSRYGSPTEGLEVIKW